MNPAPGPGYLMWCEKIEQFPANEKQDDLWLVKLKKDYAGISIDALKKLSISDELMQQMDAKMDHHLKLKCLKMAVEKAEYVSQYRYNDLNKSLDRGCYKAFCYCPHSYKCFKAALTLEKILFTKQRIMWCMQYVEEHNRMIGTVLPGPTYLDGSLSDASDGGEPVNSKLCVSLVDEDVLGLAHGLLNLLKECARGLVLDDENYQLYVAAADILYKFRAINRAMACLEKAESCPGVSSRSLKLLERAKDAIAMCFLVDGPDGSDIPGLPGAFVVGIDQFDRCYYDDVANGILFEEFDRSHLTSNIGAMLVSYADAISQKNSLKDDTFVIDESSSVNIAFTHLYAKKHADNMRQMAIAIDMDNTRLIKELKVKASKLINRNDFNDAIRMYSQIINEFEVVTTYAVEFRSKKEAKKRETMKSNLLSLRAAAYVLKNNRKSALLAVDDLSNAIQLAPDNHKPLLWRGWCYANLRKNDEAINDYKQYLKVVPDDTKIQDKLEKLEEKMKVLG